MKRGEANLDGIPQDVTAALLAYIADTLSAEERDRVEQRLLEDELFSGQMEEAEFLLLEAYADGSLADTARNTVAAWIASSPRLRGQTDIATALHRIACAKTARKAMPIRFWVMALAACLAIAIVVPLLHRQHAPAPARSLAALSPGPVPSPSQPEDTVLLVAERLRAAETGTHSVATYTIHPGRPVQIQIVLPAAQSAAAYSVGLRRLTQPPTAPMHFAHVPLHKILQTPFLKLTFKPRSLPPGEYQAEIRSRGEFYRLRFRVADTR